MGSIFCEFLVFCVGGSHHLSVPEKKLQLKGEPRNALLIIILRALRMDDILGVNISSQVVILGNAFPWVAAYFRNTPLQGHFVENH